MASPFLKISIGSLLRALIFMLLLLPVWLLVTWLCTGKRKLVIAIVDKTVLNKKGEEHVSLNWVLNQQKFTKNSKDLYDLERDYFGFFPLEKEQYQLKGLERFNNSQLGQLSRDADAAYFTDAYGIYSNEWFRKGDPKDRSGILYGGMSQQDLYFLRQMQQQHKLIVTEFNCLASPTDPVIRDGFEKSFGIRWTGWIGRYFSSFDTIKNKELPSWLIHNYKQQHGGSWPFSKSGIAFIHSDDRIVILENETHLTAEMPYLLSSEEGQKHYGLAAKMDYSFWFDIVVPDTAYNHIVSRFVIDVNEAGKKILAENKLPQSFAGITAHINKDYRFFYFSGDFADNPIRITSSYFKGVPYLKSFMYNSHDPFDRKSFFWKIYQPLVTTIMEDYYASLHPAVTVQ